MGNFVDWGRLAALTRLAPSRGLTIGLGTAALVLGGLSAISRGGSAAALVGNLILNPFTWMGAVLLVLGRRKKPVEVVRCSYCGEPNLPDDTQCRACGMS